MGGTCLGLRAEGRVPAVKPVDSLENRIQKMHLMSHERLFMPIGLIQRPLGHLDTRTIDDNNKLICLFYENFTFEMKASKGIFLGFFFFLFLLQAILNFCLLSA